MFVIVAIVAQQFPVASVTRIIVVIMIFVMHGEFPQPLSFELTSATAADMREHLQGLFSIALHSVFLLTPRFGDETVRFVFFRLFIIWCHNREFYSLNTETFNIKTVQVVEAVRTVEAVEIVETVLGTNRAQGSFDHFDYFDRLDYFDHLDHLDLRPYLRNSL